MGFSIVSTPFADRVLTLAKAYLSGLQMGLFKNTAIPPFPFTLGSYDQPSSPAYSLQSLSWPTPPDGPVGNRFITADLVTWMADPADPQEYVYGYFLFDPGTGQVVAAVSPANAPQPFVTTIHPFSVSLIYGYSYIVL